MTSHWRLETITKVGCGMIPAELGGIGAAVISVVLVGVEIVEMTVISIESIMISAGLGRGEAGMGEGTGVGWSSAVGKEKVRTVEDMTGWIEEGEDWKEPWINGWFEEWRYSRLDNHKEYNIWKKKILKKRYWMETCVHWIQHVWKCTNDWTQVSCFNNIVYCALFFSLCSIFVYFLLYCAT